MDYSTGTLVVDDEYSYSDGSEINDYDNKYKGDQTIREALVDSRNIPALKTFQAVGADNAFAFLKKLGITITNDNQEYLVESNAIGGEATPIQLSAAYAAFANGGTYYEPYTVQAVTTSDGKEFTFEPTGTEAMKDSTAYMITDMLKDVITSGTATNAQIDGLPQAGKTGTTNYTDDELAAVGGANVPYAAPDAWFAGYSTSYSIAVWLGYDNSKEYGNFLDYKTQSLTRDIYRELMSYVSEDTDYSDWSMPASVSKVSIEKYTDPLMKPGTSTPSNLISTELFVKGTEPTSVSKKYGEKLTAPTGLKASYNADKDELTITWDAYKTTGSSQPQYSVTAGTTDKTTTDTSLVIAKPAKGTFSISVSVQVGQSTSPAATIQMTIEDAAKDSSGSDSSKDSSSSESSSSGRAVRNQALKVLRSRRRHPIQQIAAYKIPNKIRRGLDFCPGLVLFYMHPFFPVSADGEQRANFTFRISRGAMVSPEKDHLVMRIRPHFPRQFLHQYFLHFQDAGLLWSNPEPLGDPFDMGIHSDGRDMETDAHHDVCRLAADPRQGHQVIKAARHFPAEMFDQSSATFLDVCRFRPV